MVKVVNTVNHSFSFFTFLPFYLFTFKKSANFAVLRYTRTNG